MNLAVGKANSFLRAACAELKSQPDLAREFRLIN
jgi:hypothetical protein